MKKPAETPSEPEAESEPVPEPAPGQDSILVNESASSDEADSSDELVSPEEPEPVVEPQPVIPPQPEAPVQTSALIPAAPLPSVHVLPAASPSHAPPPKPGTDWGRVARNILRTILLLILAVIFGGLIGLGVFLGLPWLYNRYVLPVQQHEQRLDVLETQFTEQVSAIQADNSDLLEKNETLETQLDELGGRLDTLNDDIDSYQSEQSGNQEKLAQDLAALQASLAEMETRLDTEFGEMDLSLQAQQELVATLQAGNQAQAASLQELRQQLTLLQSMELLSRARFFLTQNNLGLAQLEIEAARDQLAALQPDLVGNRAQVMQNILYRLSLALQNLQTAPVLVVDDLEVAWQMLRRGLDAPALPLFVTPTPFAPTSVLTETLVVTPTLTLTPATPYPAP